MNTTTVKHRFLEHEINPDTEILVIGTFNPEVSTNEADFFTDGLATTCGSLYLHPLEMKV